MKIIDAIKKVLGIGKVKQIEAPKGETKVGTDSKSTRESWVVEEEQLNMAREEQRKQEQREFQLMFALKNVCGKKGNLFGGVPEMKETLASTLYGYGYEAEVLLDKLDLAILSRVNLDLDILNSQNNKLVNRNIVDYISNSQSPAKTATMLVEKVRQSAIELAKQHGYTKEAADHYISYPVSTFVKTIEEEKAKSNEVGHENE